MDDKSKRTYGMSVFLGPSCWKWVAFSNTSVKKGKAPTEQEARHRAITCRSNMMWADKYLSTRCHTSHDKTKNNDLTESVSESES